MHFLLPIVMFVGVLSYLQITKTIRQAVNNGPHQDAIVWVCTGTQNSIPGKSNLLRDSLDSVDWSSSVHGSDTCGAMI